MSDDPNWTPEEIEINEIDLAPTENEGHEKVDLGRPIEEIRQELLADEDTKKIAETLEVDLEEYVELVLDYAQHPTKEAEVYTFEYDDPDFVKPEGAPDEEEMKAWVKGVVAGDIELEDPGEAKTEYAGAEGAAQRQAQAVAGGSGQTSAPKVGEEGKGQIVVDGDDEEAEELKKQLLKGQTTGRR